MKLSAYLDATDQAPGDFAAELDIAGETMRRYLAGTRVPNHDVMRQIVTRTAGVVTPNDFFDLDALAPGRAAAERRLQELVRERHKLDRRTKAIARS